jgi:hypothetical protein
MLAIAIAAASSPSASIAFDQRPAFDKGRFDERIRRPPPPRDPLEHPTSREMSDPSWRPALKWEWCVDRDGRRFRCQR